MINIAKRNNSIQFKELLNTEVMEVTEEDQSGVFVYDLLEELKSYNGKNATISIKEDLPVQPKE
ncbi:YonK family protein [Paenibacillus sp. FSL E2-0178]|uniref:YonK family protein n=1 Tax=Paenibacillus sp. FSL E2-0178 TaxID=2921361 RepID=UPI003158EB7C